MNETTKKAIFGLCGGGLVLMIGFGTYQIIRLSRRTDELSQMVQTQQREIVTQQDENRKLKDEVENKNSVIAGQEGYIRALQNEAANPPEAPVEMVPVVATSSAWSLACPAVGAIAGLGGRVVGGAAGAAGGSAVPVVGTTLGGSAGAAAGGAGTAAVVTWVCKGLVGHLPL